MYDGATVGVVIPAYNEHGFVGNVIETVPAFVDHVYVVDDCSTDATWTEISETLSTIDDLDPSHEEAGAFGDGTGTEWSERIVARDTNGTPRNRRFVGIRHVTNRGVGGAIKTGYRNALDDDVDVVAVMSGDGQMDPAILGRIIEPVVCGDSEYAKGNRLRFAEYRREMSGWRTFGNFLLTYLTRVASGYWRMMDPQNGYTAISATALERVDLETLYEDYGFCNHLLVRLNGAGLRIADVPMRAVYGDETSHIKYGTFIPSLSLLLLQSYVGRLLDGGANWPPAAAQLLGMGGLGGGVALGVGSTVQSPPVETSTGGVLSLAGLLLFFVGILVERRDNADLEVRVDPADPPWALDVGPGETSTASADEPARREG